MEIIAPTFRSLSENFSFGPIFGYLDMLLLFSGFQKGHRYSKILFGTLIYNRAKCAVELTANTLSN
jgi:hypothetical protein